MAGWPDRTYVEAMHMPRLIALCAISLAAIPAAAQAATPGKYTGKLYAFDQKDKTPYKGVKVSLKVAKSGKKLTKFTVSSAPVFCLNIFTGEGRAEFKVAYVPSAKIKGNGKFSKTYITKNDSGEEIGRQVLQGKFSGSKATGTIETQTTGCSGTSRFKLERK